MIAVAGGGTNAMDVSKNVLILYEFCVVLLRGFFYYRRKIFYFFVSG